VVGVESYLHVGPVTDGSRPPRPPLRNPTRPEPVTKVLRGGDRRPW
jgi:hypothetical protein